MKLGLKCPVTHLCWVEKMFAYNCVKAVLISAFYIRCLQNFVFLLLWVRIFREFCEIEVSPWDVFVWTQVNKWKTIITDLTVRDIIWAETCKLTSKSHQCGIITWKFSRVTKTWTDPTLVFAVCYSLASFSWVHFWHTNRLGWQYHKCCLLMLDFLFL